MMVDMPAAVVLLWATRSESTLACERCWHTQPTLLAMIATAVTCKPIDLHWWAQVEAEFEGILTVSAPTCAVHAGKSDVSRSRGMLETKMSRAMGQGIRVLP